MLKCTLNSSHQIIRLKSLYSEGDELTMSPVNVTWCHEIIREMMMRITLPILMGFFFIHRSENFRFMSCNPTNESLA